MTNNPGATGPGYIDTDANGAFIAASRELVPSLLAEVTQLRQQIQNARELHMLDAGGDDCLNCGWESGWPCATAAALDGQETTE